MNTRIKELAEQAGFQYIKDEGIGWAGNHNSSLSKFAELIVRECMELTHWKDFDMCVEQRIRMSVAQDIKEHFGVDNA